MVERRRRRVIDDTTPVDWKNGEWLKKFMTDTGRILPRRMTGNSQHRQREIARAIKRARQMALLPFGSAALILMKSGPRALNPVVGRCR